MSQHGLAKTTGFHVATNYFVSRQGVAKTKGALCCDKSNCVVTEFDQARSFFIATKCFYVATKLAIGERLYVATEYGQMKRFCVATGNIMLRPSWPGWEGFLLRQIILMSRQSWPG